MPLVEIKKLTFEIGQTKILDDLELTIGFQEIHALLGANGSGKSTLAYVLMGCDGYGPHTGEILFDGKEIGSLQTYERAQLGMTLAWQEPARFEGITVDQYVRLGREGIDPGVYLTAVGLSPEAYVHRMVDKSLSGGERKRIELASVLALKPRLAILDEPASGIDMLSVQEIIAVIRAFREGGASVLLITHGEAIGLIADRASQLCAGKIIATGDPKEIADQYKKGSCVRCDGKTCLPSVLAMTGK
jgi:Fe-S cluster assembly ATP-binding protein